MNTGRFKVYPPHILGLRVTKLLFWNLIRKLFAGIFSIHNFMHVDCWHNKNMLKLSSSLLWYLMWLWCIYLLCNHLVDFVACYFGTLIWWISPPLHCHWRLCLHSGVTAVSFNWLCQIVWNYESLSFHTASHRFGYLPDRWGTGKKLFFSSDWLLILPLGGRQEGRWRRRQSRQCSGVQVLGLVANTAARWPPAARRAGGAGGRVASAAECRCSD